jgi:hypothetical protein
MAIPITISGDRYIVEISDDKILILEYKIDELILEYMKIK